MEDIKIRTLKCHDPCCHRTLDINDTGVTERQTLMP